MFHLAPSALRWVLAMSMASLLLAWPLHQAEHARETVGATAQAASGSETPPHDPQPTSADPCLWCMSQGEALAFGGTPPEFRFHAEIGLPPIRLCAGLGPRHCALAAAPRGPPRG